MNEKTSEIKGVRKWDGDKVLSQLKEFASTLSRSPKEKDFRSVGNYGLFKASIRYFGSYIDALQTAGLRPNKRYWSRSLVITEFASIVKELGYVPTHRELKKLGREDFLNALRRHYGNQYNKLVRLHGLQPNNIKWDKDKIRKEMLSLSQKLRKTPTEREVRKFNSGLFGAAVRHFGSLNKAVMASDLQENSSFVEDDFWKYWESFVLCVLESTREKVEFHPRLPNRKIPDARADTTLFEVKLNLAQEYINKDIENYLPHADILEIWYLYGSPGRIHPKIKYIGPEEIEQILRDNNQKDLLAKLCLLKKGEKC